MRAGAAYYYQGGDVYDVRGVTIHPAFNEINYDYDVGLVEVKYSYVLDIL